MSQLDDLDRVHCETRAQWRAWLQRHRGGATEIWLVTWRKSSGRPVLAYDDMVEEALAFGWVDSKGGKVDEQRTRLLFTPRKRGSSWSRPNKLRIAKLEAAAFEAHPGGRERWDDFPRSARRGILEWIVTAKKPDTRANRVEETARLAARGERANQWPRTKR